MTTQKLYRFSDGSFDTILGYCIKNAIRYEVKTNRSWYDLIDRRKYNRMDNAEQAVYEAKLKKAAAKPQYRAWTSADTFIVCTMKEYMAAIWILMATTNSVRKSHACTRSSVH